MTAIESTRLHPSPRDRILGKTVGELRTFLAELCNGTSNYRTVHSLTQQIEHQYHRRFVVELLQNAHDAISATPNRGAGRIEFRFVLSEGDHGVLYVANDGQPFRHRDFLAIARLGQSGKDPRESIGHKGLGFRSVLEVSSAPEIFSQALEGQGSEQGTLNGFSFRFVPSVLNQLADYLRGDNGFEEGTTLILEGIRIDVGTVDLGRLVERIRSEALRPDEEVRYLSPYLLPLPVDEVPSEIRAFEEEGFSTVIRLPLRDREAAGAVVERLAELGPEMMVFLDALRELRVRDGSGAQRVFRRAPDTGTGTGARMVRITSEDGHVEEVFLSWKTVFGGENDAELEKIRSAVKDLPEAWHTLDRVELSAAVRVGEPAKGRFFIYLPTEVATGTAAHLNAPFYGDLSRTKIDFSLRINALLLEALRDWLHNDVVKGLIGGGEREASAVMDLLAPIGEAPSVVLEGRGASISTRTLFLTDHGWRHAGEARPIPVVREARCLTPSRLRAQAGFEALHPSLESRLQNVRRLLRQLGGREGPLDSELARTIESVATKDNNNFDWVEFWTEVEKLLPGRATALRGHRVLPVQDGSILASDPEGEGVRVFFPPLRGDDDDETAEGSEPLAEVPPSLRARIAFLSDRIPLRRTVAGGRRESTAARKYLQDALVDDYGADRILRRVVLPSLPAGDVPLDSADGRRCAEALDFGFRIVRSARDRATLLPLLRDLRVPCLGGWFRAREAACGPGWDGEDGRRLIDLLEELDTEAARSERQCLLLPPADSRWSGHGEFLATGTSSNELGIAKGIRLREDQKWVGRCWLQKGSRPDFPRIPPSGIPVQSWECYVDDVRSEIKPTFVGPHSYRWEAQPYFAGLDRVEQLSDLGRRNLTFVLLRSMSHWKPTWRASRLVKEGGQHDRLEPKSFLFYALRELPWLWTGHESPGARPRDRWFVSAVAEPGQRHQYDHLHPVPAEIVSRVQRIEPSPISILAELGMPVLDPEQSTASPRLLEDLAAALEEGRVAPTNWAVFLGQLRTAWSTFQPASKEAVPHHFVVARGGRPPEPFVPTPEHPMYVPDVRLRGLESGPLAAFPILYMRPGEAIRLFPLLEAALGASVRRLSLVEIDACQDEKLWFPSPEIAPLEQSVLAWLVPFSLCVATFHDSRQHAQTKLFREPLATLRAARVDRVVGLKLRLGGGAPSTAAAPVSAFWQDDLKVLLYDDTEPGWLSALAGPLAAILDRGDVLHPLRLALTSLKGNATPDEEQQLAALATLEIEDQEFNEVRQWCTEDLAWVLDRVLPAVALLRPDLDPAGLGGTNSLDELRARIDAIVGGDPPADWLIAKARASGGDGAMGRALWERLGEQAELDRWNAVMQRLTPPRRRIENTRWLEEFRVLRSQLLTPLRALLRHLCLKRGRPADYLAAAEPLTADPAADLLRYKCWQVDVRQVIAALRPTVEVFEPDRELLAALDRASDVGELSLFLREIAPEIDPEIDPSEYLRENRDLLRKVFEALRMMAVAHHRSSHDTVGPWGIDLVQIAASIEEQLRLGEGHLVRFDEARVLAWVAARLPESLLYERLREALGAGVTTVEGLRISLGVTDAMLKRVDDDLANNREDERRRRRLTEVCGTQVDPEDSNIGAEAWKVLNTSLPDDALEDLDPSRHVALEAFRKRDAKRRPPDRPQGKVPTHRRRLSDREAHLVGLIGEMLAFRLLTKRFGADRVSAGAWRSENSQARFPGNACDDGAGYDFVIVDARRTWYIEVKATLDDSEGFELGSSEVRAALEMANQRTRCYRILHIVNVRTQPTARFLPNPFDRASKGLFDLDEAGFRVRYRSSDSDADE